MHHQNLDFPLSFIDFSKIKKAITVSPSQTNTKKKFTICIIWGFTSSQIKYTIYFDCDIIYYIRTCFVLCLSKHTHKHTRRVKPHRAISQITYSFDAECADFFVCLFYFSIYDHFQYMVHWWNYLLLMWQTCFQANVLSCIYCSIFLSPVLLLIVMW